MDAANMITRDAARVTVLSELGGIFTFKEE